MDALEISSEDTAVCTVFSGAHCYAVTAEGQYSKLECDKEKVSKRVLMGGFGPLGLNMGNFTFCLGPRAASQVRNDGRMTELPGGGWSFARGMIRSGDSVVVFHAQGCFSVNPQTGEYERLNRANWSSLKALLYDSETDSALAFCPTGIYRVNAQDGGYVRINRESWTRATGAVWSFRGPLVFHQAGLFLVSLEDGTSQMVSQEKWRFSVQRVVSVNDRTALVFHGSGLYIMNLDDYSYKKIEEAGSWGFVNGIWPTNPDDKAVCRFCDQ